MTDEIRDVIPKLIELSAIDGSMARILVDKQKVNEDQTEKQTKLESLKSAFVSQDSKFKSHKSEVEKEEKTIQFEREKLVNRRKALASIPDYKAQQAGDREIEAISKQLDRREEELLKLMEQGELEQQENSKAEEALEQAQNDYDQAIESGEEQLVTLEQRYAEKEKERADLISQISDSFMSQYEKVRRKFPMNPLAPIRKNACCGCNVVLGPQMLVNVSRADGLVECPGCRRILYIEISPE